MSRGLKVLLQLGVGISPFDTRALIWPSDIRSVSSYDEQLGLPIDPRHQPSSTRVQPAHHVMGQSCIGGVTLGARVAAQLHTCAIHMSSGASVTLGEDPSPSDTRQQPCLTRL